MLYPSATEGGGSADDEAATIGSKNASSTLVADGRLDDVGVVVLDEVHYLSDPGRGTVWEETVIYCPPAIQLVCLSATVGNPTTSSVDGEQRRVWRVRYPRRANGVWRFLRPVCRDDPIRCDVATDRMEHVTAEV